MTTQELREAIDSAWRDTATMLIQRADELDAIASEKKISDPFASAYAEGAGAALRSVAEALDRQAT